MSITTAVARTRRARSEEGDPWGKVARDSTLHLYTNRKARKLVFSQLRTRMKDPPLAPAGEHAAAAPTPLHAPGPGPGGGGPPSKETNTTRTDPSTSDGEGFIVAQSYNKHQRARREARKKEQGQSPAATGTALPRTARTDTSPQQRGKRTQSQPRRDQDASGKRKQYTEFERMFFRLRDYVRQQVDDSLIVELIAKMQRLLRTKEQEDKHEFARVYVESKEEDVEHLCAMIKDLIGVQRIPKQELVNGFSKFCLIATHSEPKIKPTFSWESRLKEAEGGATTTEEHAAPPNKAWVQEKRDLRDDEANALVRLLNGDAAMAPALDSLKETYDVHAHALLSSLAAEATTATLVIQFSGNMRLPENITFMGRDRQLTDDSGLTNANDNFRREVVNSYYEPSANRLYFVMRNAESASVWTQQQILIQQRMMPLMGLRSNGTDLEEGTVAKDEYEFFLMVPSGKLMDIQLLHLLTGILKLTVKFFQRAPLPSGQGHDPNVFRVVVVSVGCPNQIRNRTCAKWNGEIVWLYHHVFHPTPPCTTCAHPSHLAKNCLQDKEDTTKYIMHLAQPTLDIGDERASSRQVEGKQLHTWIQQTVDQQRERSMMGGEDFDAQEPAPNAPRGRMYVYVTPAARVRNIRLQHALKHYQALNLVQRLLHWRRKAEARPAWIEEQHAFRLPSPVFENAPMSTPEQLDRVSRCASAIPISHPLHHEENQKQLEYASQAFARRSQPQRPDDHNTKQGVLTTPKGERYLLSMDHDRHAVLKKIQAKASEKPKAKKNLQSDVPSEGNDGGSAALDQPPAFAFPTRTLELRGTAGAHHHPPVTALAAVQVDEVGADSTSLTTKANHTKHRADSDDSMDALDAAYEFTVQKNAMHQEQQPKYFSLFPTHGTSRTTCHLACHLAPPGRAFSDSENIDMTTNPDAQGPLFPPSEHTEFETSFFTEREEKQSSPPLQSPPPGVWSLPPQVGESLMDAQLPPASPTRGRTKERRERTAPHARRNSTGTVRKLFESTSPSKEARQARRNASPSRRSSVPYTTTLGAEDHSDWAQRDIWSEPSKTPSPTVLQPSFELLPSQEFSAFATSTEAEDMQDSEDTNLSPGFELVMVLPPPKLPSNAQTLVKVADYENGFRAKRITVAGDGNCWSRSVYGAITGDDVDGHLDATNKKSNDYGHFYNRKIYGTFQSCVDGLVANQTFTWTDLFREFFQQDAPGDEQLTEIMVRKRLAIGVGLRLDTTTAVELWATTSIVMLTALYLRQALLVVDVSREEITHAQLHYLEPTPNSEVEKIKTRLLDPLEAHQFMQAHFHHKVLPLVFFRTFDISSPRTGEHFSCLRYEQQLYTDWSARGRDGISMRDRLDDVYTALGLPVVPQGLLPVDLTPPEDYDDASVYAPSDASDDGATTAPPARTRATTLSTIEYIELLESLPMSSREVSTNPTWYKALNANELAFIRWRGGLPQQEHSALKYKEVTLRAACHLVDPYSQDLVHIIRELPYPEVQLARIDPLRLARLGKFCIQTAAAQRLKAYCARITADTDHANTYQWIQKLETDFSAKTWRTVASVVKWAEKAMRQYGLPQVQERDWCIMTAVQICLPKGFPEVWRSFTFHQQCFQFQEWLAIVDNQPFAKGVTRLMLSGDWASVGSMLTDAVAIINAEMAEADGGDIRVRQAEELGPQL